MTSTTSGEGTSYEGEGGGTGGKFRKRASRRPQPTPYDRPLPTSLTNPRNNGWLPKLVDSASKLISSSARLFFSSVFRKCPPLQLPPEACRESRDRPQDAAPDNSPRVEAPAVDNGGNPSDSYDSSGITKLEQILKQKTFSRSEVDRLTELLRSKTIDLPNNGNDHRLGEINVPQPVSADEVRQNVSIRRMQDNIMETHRFDRRVSTPLISSQVSEQAFASPADLAKAYMGSKPSKVSPSMLGLRSQALRRNANLLDKVSYPPKMPFHVGIPENGSTNPRYRGRSAIYTMARTPNLKYNLTATKKGSTSAYDSYGGPSASPSLYVREHDAQFGSKQLALKRRSSALEGDTGSITPIRRLRQKTTLSTPQNLSLPVNRIRRLRQKTTLSTPQNLSLQVNRSPRPPISSTRKPFPVEEPNYRTLHPFGESGDNIPCTSYTPPPSKSSEMATRILQQLENSVPKEKSSEGKVVTGMYKSPSQLTPSMLRGQALRSLEDVDSSKILQNALESHKVDELCNISLLDAPHTTSQKQDKLEVNGAKEIIVSRATVAPAIIREAAVSDKDAGVNTEDSVFTPPLSQPPQKKWSFHMSMHEDFLDLDDEIQSSETTSTPLSQEKVEQENVVVESKIACNEAVMVNKTSTLSEIKPPDGPLIKNSAELGTSDAPVADEKTTRFTFNTVPASSTTFRPVVETVQSTSAFDAIVPLKESNSTPALFSADYESVDNVPPLPLSSPSAVSESLGPHSNAPLESKRSNRMWCMRVDNCQEKKIAVWLQTLRNIVEQYPRP